MQLVQEREKRYGLIGTILFHLLLLLIFLFFGLTHMVPPPEQGILINFGTSNQGMGEVEPQSNEKVTPVAEESAANPETPTDPSTSQEEVITQDNMETLEVPTEKEEEKPTQEEIEAEKKRLEEAENKKKQDEANKKAADMWSKIKQNKKSSGEGETGKPGNQGDPNGDPNAKSHVGGPTGGGIGFQLAGRKLLKASRPENTKDEGTVVVDIIVDRYGKVIKAVPGGRGTTTSSAALFDKAKTAAYATHFSPNPEAPEEQKGVMTFVFILQ